jgi:hypothetical protein
MPGVTKHYASDRVIWLGSRGATPDGRGSDPSREDKRATASLCLDADCSRRAGQNTLLFLGSAHGAPGGR